MSRDPILIDPEFERTAKRLNGISWGASVGKPVPSTLAEVCRAVGSVEQAIELLESDEWEEWSMELQGELTVYLDRVNRRRYQDWNVITRRAKEILVQHEPAIIAGLNAAGVNGAVALDTVRWDVVGALVCAGFMDCKPPTDVLKLLDVYEAGHLPVGWDAETQRVLVY